jgi:hypothetical protein
VRIRRGWGRGRGTDIRLIIFVWGRRIDVWLIIDLGGRRSYVWLIVVVYRLGFSDHYIVRTALKVKRN